jgi:predicted alpha/beta-hydrolase family hydrolase
MFSALVDTLSTPVDRAVLAAQHAGVAFDRELARLSHDDRIARLLPLVELYGDPALLAWPNGFLQAPAPIAPEERPVTRDVVDLVWPSASVPWNADVAEKYLSFKENRTVHARLFGLRPGPTVMLVHGYGAGYFRFETRAWPVAALRRRGWNVVLTTLPFHARRASPGRAFTPPFPASDPRVTNEGFRQAIYDLVALGDWLRARGNGPVGAWGISLGGYTTALLATVDPSLAFAALVLPLGSPADYAHLHGRLGTGHDADVLHAAVERVNVVISPYVRSPTVPPERVRVLAARADRITGPAQAERLARHFEAEVEYIAGGHIVNTGLLSSYSALAAWMGDGGHFA